MKFYDLNVFDKLTFKIVFPIFITMTILGIFLYFFILNTVTEFSLQSIKKDLNTASRSLYNVVDDGFGKLLNTGKSLDNISIRIQKADTLGEIEDFVRNVNLKVILFESKKNKLLLNNTDYNLENIINAKLLENKISNLKYKETDYYVWYFTFEPWEWNIVLMKDVRDYSGLIQKVQIIYFATGIMVFVISLVLVYYLHKTIKVPIARLIAPIKLKTSPNYTGVFEFEFLSNSIRDMMNVIKENENIQKRKAEELQKTIKELKLMQTQLIESEKMAALGGLVAGVAHEINTPVGNGITGITHLVDITESISEKYKYDDISEDEFEEYLKTSSDLSTMISINLQKTAHLVKSFKQVAVDQSTEEKRIFNLKDYLNEVLFSLSPITQKTKLSIILNCDDRLVINSYPGAFSQVISNLIINSIRHGYKEKQVGSILIIASKYMDSLKITYKDDGCGISKDNLEKIFDPFFTTNRKAGGTGLGLNIIQNIIVKNLKGTITCMSEKNHGVEFTIKISEL